MSTSAPRTARVLIVSRTRISSERRCVGGITLPQLESLRLLDASGQNCSSYDPYRIGQIWNLRYQPHPDPVPPHTEDVLVLSAQREQDCDDIERLLRDNLSGLEQRGRFWRGSTDRLFGDVLKATDRGAGYVDHNDFPDKSTGFWIPDYDLVLQESFDHLRYRYRGVALIRFIPYVGTDVPEAVVPAGTLCRVSLARWWARESGLERVCYLQLSGAYLPVHAPVSL